MFSCEFSDFGGPTILQGLLGVCDDPLRVLRGFWPFPGCGGGGLGGCVQGRGLGAHASPSGFFLLGGFGGTLLVVSVLGIVYDCHLLLLLESWGVINGSWWSYGSFPAWG